MQNFTFGAAFRFLNFNLHTFWLSITCENRVICTTELNINHNDSTKDSTDGVVDRYGDHTAAAAVRWDVVGYASILGLTTRDHSNILLRHNIERFAPKYKKRQHKRSVENENRQFCNLPTGRYSKTYEQTRLSSLRISAKFDHSTYYYFDVIISLNFVRVSA